MLVFNIMFKVLHKLIGSCRFYENVYAQFFYTIILLDSLLVLLYDFKRIMKINIADYIPNITNKLIN